MRTSRSEGCTRFHPIADPRARFYVKTLILGSIEGTHPLNLGDPCKAELGVLEFQGLTAQLKHEARLLREVLDVQRFLNPDSREIDLDRCPQSKNWTQNILAGNMEAGASLLISILPNIQKLRFVVEFQIWRYPFLTKVKQLIHAAVTKRHASQESPLSAS